jgi:hypothetical protein
MKRTKVPEHRLKMNQQPQREKVAMEAKVALRRCEVEIVVG